MVTDVMARMDNHPHCDVIVASRGAGFTALAVKENVADACCVRRTRATLM